jgi:precorrin-6B methylase 2
MYRIEMASEISQDQCTVFLIPKAKTHPDILIQIKNHLKRGVEVVIKAGFFHAIPELITKMRELKVDESILVCELRFKRKSKTGILIVEIWFQINNTWGIIIPGFPLLEGTS